MPAVLDLMAASAEGSEVRPGVVRGVAVDVVPVELLTLTASDADVRFGIEPVSLSTSRAGGRSLPLWLWDAPLRLGERPFDVLGSLGPGNGVPVAFEPAGKAVGGLLADRSAAVCAALASHTVSASGRSAARAVAALVEGVKS